MFIYFQFSDLFSMILITKIRPFKPKLLARWCTCGTVYRNILRRNLNACKEGVSKLLVFPLIIYFFWRIEETKSLAGNLTLLQRTQKLQQQVTNHNNHRYNLRNRQFQYLLFSGNERHWNSFNPRAMG